MLVSTFLLSYFVNHRQSYISSNNQEETIRGDRTLIARFGLIKRPVPLIRGERKKKSPSGKLGGSFTIALLLLIGNLFHDGLEGLRIVHGEVGEHLAVDLDTGLGELAHEY